MAEYDWRMKGVVLAVAFLAALSGPLVAEADAPAQLANVSGDVSIVHADTGLQEAAVPSATLSAGDFVATGDGSHTSLRVGGQTLRLDAQTQVRVVDLDAGAAEVQIAAGNVDVTAPAGSQAQIDTPTATVRPARPGSFRVSVADGGQTVVRVSSGSVTIDGPSGTQTVVPGATVIAE
jgi:ferric-dicitrate binding protein FerR (iron transport regulator)